MERPKRGEDEDELLKFQQEFLASKAVPSVSVVKKADKHKLSDTSRDVVRMDTLPAELPAADSVPTKKSRFRSDREKSAAHDASCKPSTSTTHQSSAAPDMDDVLDRHEEGMAAVLASIIERDTRNSAFSLPRSSTEPFPKVMERKIADQPKASGGKKQSLFARQIQQQGTRDFGVMLQQEAMKMDTTDSGTNKADSGRQSGKGTDTTSHIVSGIGLSASQADEEAHSIHQENLEKLGNMSEQEILEEQQKLLQMLDPKLVEFLRSKSNTQVTSQAASKPKPKPKKNTQKPQTQNNGDTPDLPEDVLMEGRDKWVHMDKIEYDKLEWMKDLPPPSAGDTQTGQQARFDFHGSVVPADADVPVTKGLHHHGDEPERAGYTLEELFTLARSSNIQQRSLALGTLTHIIQKAKEGALEEYVQTPILPTILDGGVIFLLRWACDDSVDAVVASAVSALHALLCNPADEAALEMTSSWYQGLVSPALLPARTVEKMAEEKEENEDNAVQETDADVAKRDLIQGLVTRMLLLQRLYYILDKTRPQAPTVINILQILTRVVQHSTQLAYEVARSSELMSLIFRQFLPTTWEPQDPEKPVSSVYRVPVPAAMRLIGCLFQAGRNIASSLSVTYSVGNIILRYLAVPTGELQLFSKEAENLQKESLRTWQILLSYGLGAEMYLELYTSLAKDLQSIVSGSSSLSVCESPDLEVRLVSLLESVLPVAATPAVKTRFNQSESAESETAIESPVNWSHVEGMLPLVKLLTDRWLTHLADNYTLQRPSLQFPSACLNFMATYYTKCEGQPTVNAVECLQQVEDWYNSNLLPFLRSYGFQTILSKLSSSSNLLSAPAEKRRETAECLPEFGCDKRESTIPVIGSASPIGFLLAFCRLAYRLCKMHKGISEQLASSVVNSQDVMSYMRRVSTCPYSHLHNNHFSKFENILQYYIIKLATLTTTQHAAMYHQAAFDLMVRLQGGDEYLAHDLLSTVLFNSDFLPEGKEEELATASLAQMKISETHILKSATQEQITTNNCQLLGESVKSLATIRAQYFVAFAHMERKVALSRSRYLQLPFETESLLMHHIGEYLMPHDWIFLPLVELYNKTGAMDTRVQDNLPPSCVTMVTSVLQWIFMLESWRKKALAHVSVTLKVSRIMCVFLAGSNLFLEKTVYPYLATLFRSYTTPQLLDRMDFDEHIPGISSFYDLYMTFLDQYEAVSFGDAVFGAYVLLPMQQRQDVLLRRAVWQERTNLLRTLSIPVSEMLIDIERYLTPDETDMQLIQLYVTALLSGAVRHRWSPVLFLIAVHHTNRFLYYSQDARHQDVRNRLWSGVLRCRDENLKKLIVMYKNADVEVENSMVLYTELPPNRQKLLQDMENRFNLT